MNWDDLRATLNGVDLEHLKPRGDFVLVQELPDESMIVEASKAALQYTKGKFWHENRATGLRRGLVVACGDGDRIFSLFCSDCMAHWDQRDPAGNDGVWYPFPQRTETAKSFRCRICGDPMEIRIDPKTSEPYVGRCPMHVAPGDEIVFPQTPANDLLINGVRFSMIHEEQHVLAVIERESTSSGASDQLPTMRDCADRGPAPETQAAPMEKEA